MDYRIYFQDRNGHIQAVEELACENDAEAVRVLENHQDPRAKELWNQARPVVTHELRAKAG